MSDVPELDALLEEHKIFKFNTAWDRAERTQLAILRFMIVFSVSVFACLLVGVTGIVVVTPMLFAVKKFIPNPPWRDPFKRYKYM